MAGGKKVCVIGGGTSGLAGMVQLINEGIEVRFFRRLSPSALTNVFLHIRRSSASKKRRASAASSTGARTRTASTTA
jgi:cation diffusion facilitator CzcD-associated flavoprotein CzcO